MTISNLLKYSPEAYEGILFETWFTYADIISVNEQDLQKILANAAYFNWFLQEYRRLEAEFLQEIQPYIGKIDTKTTRDFYDEKICLIANHYPKSLLKNARKIKIIN
ncbi:hypothetical protein [Psychroflexus sp. ALD_RP9]|uniref:hypothetical protein n=1 Tax=Psychroflexus sp. ALD_RP9 TaxID=2777186 RepID=UPI001A8E322B|nr:hypothetical protein [Psychroflexus sp. ALD_RP9]QSS96615.1 hypothetical protein IMZ30_09195 [Psychroflexus sp. ALD_RP9]